MKKEAILIILLAFTMPLVSAGLFDWLKEKIQLAPGPSQPTDVRVQVGNAAPTIQSISVIPAVSLSPSPSTTPVVFTFTARDSNGASDLNDATASANFNKVGESTRTATCVFQSQSGKQRTYECTVVMQYYDDAGTWNVGVSIQDQASLSASSSSTFPVNLLKDISIFPATINFPAVEPEQGNVPSSVSTTITNNGNFETPLDGDIKITSFDLLGETTPLEIIPALNFRASGSSGSATVCTTGTGLTDSTAISITANLPRGSSGSNTEDLTYCITSIPADISTQFYSATGGRAWIIEI